ncbi:hypothetical protein [Bradyrhizobium sp. F1.13.3]|uniref:hypothetical protein n=1 Tax=Bradyrhizobium sp. F1.13.3 TaxID=3156351 RepID=UPI003392C49A
MAPRKSRKKVSAAREYKLRLPPALSERIANDASAQGKPQSRIIIEDLEAIPYLRSVGIFDTLIKDMDYTLSRYSARVILSDITDDFLQTVREAVEAYKKENTAELRKRVDKISFLIRDLEQLKSGKPHKRPGG